MKEQSMGRILRRIRIEQGMTQEALVEGICTAGYLSRVENGSQIPSRQIYQLLMERLGESGYSSCLLAGRGGKRADLPRTFARFTDMAERACG